jgi:hypothetical protein
MNSQDYSKKVIEEIKGKPRKSLLTGFNVDTQEGVRVSTIYLFGIIPIFKSIRVKEQREVVQG